MLIERLTLKNLLSFGPQGQTIRFEPLSVLIGPNGSGKSNLLEAIDLLRNLPDDMTKWIREGGGMNEWLWKQGGSGSSAALEVICSRSGKQEHPLVPDVFGCPPIRYSLTFGEELQRPRVQIEDIAVLVEGGSEKSVYAYHDLFDAQPRVSVNGEEKPLLLKRAWNYRQSILAQLRDPIQYPEITDFASQLARIHTYREFSFGRRTSPRMPQPADMPNEYLAADASNLGLILNRLRGDPPAKARLIEALQALYDGIDDFHVQVEGGSVQVFLQEGNIVIPATRLSDGTLRYLCLLAILCHPSPPPLICIEEPELGLHPDVIRTLADLLQEASKRTQIIVTTHSDVLVDAMTGTPSSVYVFEKREGQTTVKQLTEPELRPWLERYRLGELWKQGEIGGTRW